MEYEKESSQTRLWKMKRRRHLVRWIIGLAAAAAVFAGITAYGVDNYRTNPELVNRRDREETETYEDGSLKSKKRYGSDGILVYEYEDLGEYTRETEYVICIIDEKEVPKVSRIIEKDKKGNTIREETHDVFGY